jgi:hypothetical protein
MVQVGGFGPALQERAAGEHAIGRRPQPAGHVTAVRQRGRRRLEDFRQALDEIAARPEAGKRVLVFD